MMMMMMMTMMINYFNYCQPSFINHNLWHIYRVAQKKRPELCVTITARILHGAKFPLAHL